MTRLFSRWLGSRAARGSAMARLSVEPLGERVLPTVFTTKIDWSGPGDEGPEARSGVLAITPPATQVSPHTVQINQQVAQVTLPSGDVIIGHGLKTAEGQTAVVNWIPT